MTDDPHAAAPFAAVELDQGLCLRSYDASFCTLFGCKPDELVGVALDRLFCPRDRRGALELSTGLHRGSAVDVVIALRIAEQDHLTRLRLAPGAAGFRGFIEKVADHDPLHRLVSVERRWRAMLRSSDDGIVVLDNDGRIIEHNVAFFALMHVADRHDVSLSDDALVGRRLADLLGAAVPGLSEFLAGSQRDLAAREFAARVNSFEVEAKLLDLPHRARAGTFVLVRDISDELQVKARDLIIETDLARARDFQRLILSAPPTLPSYEVDVVYKPLDQVGGDLYDISLVATGRVRIFVADATGHGVAAALVTMLVKSAYDSVKYTLGGPRAVLAALNDCVASSYKSLDTMFTGMILDFACETGELEYAIGAHPPPLLVNGTEITELDTGGTMLGVQAYRHFPSWSHKIDPGASIYLVTDGIEEARRPSGEYFGERRMFDAIMKADRLPVRAGEAVFDDLDMWLRPARPNDDVTIVSLRPTSRRITESSP